MRSIVLVVASVHALSGPAHLQRIAHVTCSPAQALKRSGGQYSLRGGSTSLQASVALTGALSGAMALPATAAIAAAAGTLAYIRQAYIFSLSYGLAMLGIGGAVLLTAPASPLLLTHSGLVAMYGARLFAFLFWRQKFQAGNDGEARLKALDKTPRLQRTPIIASTAVFYALLSSPLVFHFQSAPLAGAAATLSTAGSALAAIGLVYEAVADQQKSLFKMASRASGGPEELFTGGLYALRCTHRPAPTLVCRAGRASLGGACVELPSS